MFSRDEEYRRVEDVIVKAVHGYHNLVDCLISRSRNMARIFDNVQRLISFPASMASEALLQILELPLKGDELTHIDKSSDRTLLISLVAWSKIALAIHSVKYFNILASYLEREVRLATKEGLRFIILKDDIRQLTLFAYLSGDEKIIKLFKKYFSVPKASVFKGYEVPECIRAMESESAAVIERFTSGDMRRTQQVERSAITIQRFFRAHQRRREERVRMSPDVDANQVMLDASRPYIPKKCRADLAIRIVRAASKVVLFHAIYHYTDRCYLTSVFDEGLYGRRSLLQHHMPFQPSSLCQTDITNGDENIICFAPNFVDTNALAKGVQIELDLNRLEMTNPCILYKQADLCLYFRKERVVWLGEKKLTFIHTGPRRYDCQTFQLLEGDGFLQHVVGVAFIKNDSLISYNRAQLHQILILNFFRFLDALTSLNHPKSTKQAVDDIYNRIDALTDSELAKFLFDVGNNISDTAEFNFYGAHLIDFDSLTAIRLYQRQLGGDIDAKIDPYYTFSLPELVKDLQRGHLQSYRELQENLPEVASSYRLNNYLLTKVTHPRTAIELQRQLNRCDAPLYISKKC